MKPLGFFFILLLSLAAGAEVPTFNRDIAPILFENCAACHRPNEVAPFPLLTYEDARRKAKTIARVVEERSMPPWKAAQGHGEFLGQRRLNDGQIATIRRWAEAGAPEGAGRPPPAPKFPEGWFLGRPDLVLKMPEPFICPAEGPDIYQCFVLPTNLTEDKYVTAVEYRPGNRRVVHHAILHVDTSGRARELDVADPGPGYRQSGGVGFRSGGGLGGWAPGTLPRHTPEGVARLLRKHSDIVVQTHFHPSGKPEEEQSQIGLYFAKKPPQKLSHSFPLFGWPLNIPAGEKDYRVRGQFTLPLDVEVFGIMPHAHLLAREIKVQAVLPDGKTQPMIWIPDWDFNWQEQYQYTTPLRLPKGTRLEMQFRYDNSADNPRNPHHPPRRVRWGEQTTDEMAITFFQFVIPHEIGALQLLQLRGALQEQRRLRR